VAATAWLLFCFRTLSLANEVLATPTVIKSYLSHEVKIICIAQLAVLR
jgi:hypothetical protein